MKKTLGIFCVILLAGCARIPVQSVTLMQQIKDEGARMHRLNIAYVNKLFDDKLEGINDFIKNQYTPELIKNIQLKTVGIDMNKEWPNVVPGINAAVNQVKDSLTRTLETNRLKIVTRLNEDYQVFDQACASELGLLISAGKADESAKQAANALLQKISGNKINISGLETTLDNFLKKGSNAADNIISFQATIDKLLNN